MAVFKCRGVKHQLILFQMVFYYLHDLGYLKVWKNNISKVKGTSHAYQLILTITLGEKIGEVKNLEMYRPLTTKEREFAERMKILESHTEPGDPIEPFE
ncbi:MAG: hypothetical protein ACRC8A_19925 [Microcoleaceae cyanobacterium]